MADNREIWVFSEKPALLAELLTAARSLSGETGGTVVAVGLGPRGEVELAARGAGRIIWLGEVGQGRLVDDFVPTLAGLVEAQKPAGVLIGSTKRGRAIAGRLAARMGVTAITDVKQFETAGGEIRARHMIFGGGAVRDEKPVSEVMLATIGPGVFEAQAPPAGGDAAVVEAPFVEPAWRVTVRERRPLAAASVDLTAAKKVVCSGRGIAREEDLALVNDLARALGAEVACTRPLAEGLGWLPRERYIGISGASIRPDLYLGVGVSGQVQHTVGMGDARVVVAINKDKDAPIFAQADYGIVGDLYAVVPELTKALRERK